jgi:molybdenum cofactor cytidylyltransferase
MPGQIVGIILAAGMSRRLGRPKQLLDLGGKPLIAHVVQRALASQLDSVIVVTGHAGDEVARALDGVDVRIVVNEAFADGQGTSFVAGVTAADDADAIVVLLGDQPLISVESINNVVLHRRSSERTPPIPPIVMTSYGKISSHPTLIGRELFGELLLVTGDQGAREVIRAHRDEVVTIPGDQDAPPADIDTEGAYQELLAAWQADSGR